MVNGITAGLAGLTSLGVPLTHREHAHGVVFVTGHAKPGDSGTDWPALAATARDAKLTLVIYMGVSGSQQIQTELLTGLPAHTPVAVIQHATLPQQRHAVTTLGQLRATIEHEGLGSPAVIVVGDVVQRHRRSSGAAAARPHGLNPRASAPLHCRSRAPVGALAEPAACSTNSTSSPKATAPCARARASSPAPSRCRWPSCVSSA